MNSRAPKGSKMISKVSKNRTRAPKGCGKGVKKSQYGSERDPTKAARGTQREPKHNRKEAKTKPSRKKTERR